MSGRLPALTPIRELAQGRPQEHGKVKTGITVNVKGSTTKTRPTSINTFRFVSTDEGAIRQLAEQYGAAAQQAWPEAKPGQVNVDSDGKFDVVTNTNEIDLILADDPLGGTPIYEAWGSGSRCLRRCDADATSQTACSLLHQEDVNGDITVWRDDVPCQCILNQERLCKPTTRLSVILPGVRFAGVWAYKSGSWDVAREFQQMLAILQEAQARGLKQAKMRLEQRHKPGKNYTVPVLFFDGTVVELMAGAGHVSPQVGAGQPVSIEARAQAALPAAPGPLDVERQQINEMWGKLDADGRKAFGEEFGGMDRANASMDDLMTVSNWLRSNGGWTALDEEPY